MALQQCSLKRKVEGKVGWSCNSSIHGKDAFLDTEDGRRVVVRITYGNLRSHLGTWLAWRIEQVYVCGTFLFHLSFVHHIAVIVLWQRKKTCMQKGQPWNGRWGEKRKKEKNVRMCQTLLRGGIRWRLRSDNGIWQHGGSWWQEPFWGKLNWSEFCNILKSFPILS